MSALGHSRQYSYIQALSGHEPKSDIHLAPSPAVIGLCGFVVMVVSDALHAVALLLVCS
jgi:hypothetical protein